MELFDWDWRFHRGEVEGGQRPNLDDSAWRRVDLPHDWSIEGPFDHDIPADEAIDRAWGEFFVNTTPGESLTASLAGYRPGGTGWYRKHFTLPESAAGKRVFIQFDGVYMDADVWVNDHHLGNHPYGYTSFQYELTPLLRYGQEGNVLAVRVNVQQPCSRWYSGAGIYRHVWFTVTEPIHIAHWGTYVTTPEVSENEVLVRIRTQVQNQSDRDADVSLETAILDDTGQEVASTTDPMKVRGESLSEFDQSLKISKPALWSIENPHLYRVVSVLSEGERVLDRTTTSFGIRTFEFAADRGFFLNGEHVAIKGVNMHHDQGCLGARAYDRAIERQLRILKKMGCNAIRTAHNPPASALFDACDRMGFIVMDEAFDEWKQSKMPHGYGRFFDEWSERDLVSMIRRDRNHPCIVMWSIGNEIPAQASENGYEMAKRLADICRREDPTRAVTSGCNNVEQALKTGYAKPLDMIGINYNLGWHDELRGKIPTVASETTVALSTRGKYNLVPENGKLKIEPRIGHVFTSYDLATLSFQGIAVGISAEKTLNAFKDRPWVAGQFVWSGFDYLGEPLPMKWPSRSSYFGILDLCGFPKDRFYLYQSQWTEEPVVHILPHWNWEGFEGMEIPVWCYTNCDSVELFLNGKSLGVRDWSNPKHLHFEWAVPYEAGTLRGVGKKDGKTVCSDEVHTAGLPTRVALSVDRPNIKADGQDLAYVTVRIVDDNGYICPNADDTVSFVVTGEGYLVGVGNGNPTSLEQFDADSRMAFHGLCLAVVRSTRQPGEIRFTASVEDLESDEIIIRTK